MTTAAKVREILGRPVAALPLAVDLPRLSHFVRIYEGRKQLFPGSSGETSGENATSATRTQKVRGILSTLAERVGGPDLGQQTLASFNRTFRATLPKDDPAFGQQQHNGNSSSSNASTSSPEKRSTASPLSVELGASEIVGTSGLERIADGRLRHALASLPSAFVADSDDSDSDSDDDEEETCIFHFVLEKPDANVTLTVTTGGDKPSATVHEGKPAGPADCTLKTSAAVLTSILQGALNPAIALQAGHLEVDSLPRLMMFGQSFDLSKDRFAEFSKVHPLNTGSAMPSPGPATVEAAKGATNLDGVLSNTLKRYLTEEIGDSNKMLRLAKAMNSATPSPAMIELKMALGMKNMTKDVPGSWTIDLVFFDPISKEYAIIPPAKSPAQHVVYVVTRKSEQDLKNAFSYSWELVLRYEFVPGSDDETVELVDVQTHVSSVTFDDTTASPEEETRKAEVGEILAQYSKPPQFLAFLLSDANSNKAEASSDHSSAGDAPQRTVSLSVLPEGVEVEEYDDGSRYEGTFNEAGERHGHGSYQSADGHTYVGDYRNDVRHGSGIYTTKEGARYEGEFRDGLPNGKGVYVFENGDVYTGMFQNDEFHGQGSWSNNGGSSYHGEFKDGKRDGRGVLFSLGITYDGEWKDGLFHGRGIFIYRKGDIYEGEFQKGQFHGTGRYVVRETSQLIEGQFENGKPVGTSVEVAPDTAPPTGEALERLRADEAQHRQRGI